MTSNLIPKDGEIDLEIVPETAPKDIVQDVVLEATIPETTEIPESSQFQPEISKEIPKKPRAPRKKKVFEGNSTNLAKETSLPELVPESISTPTSINASTISVPIHPPTLETNKFSKIKTLYKAFRPTEKLIFIIAGITLVISTLSILSGVNNFYSVELPARGGTYTEGIVGYARFINPLLGYTDADKDMISLVYSGLLKATPEGRLVADLAKSWEVSDDGLTYTFKLKDGLTFQDGKPLTTDDIEFTITKAQDPLIKSPRAENWTGVALEKVSPTEIKFILKRPYASFLENMTLGILPKHIWSNIENEAFDINTYNREPVGSGPYKIKKAYRDDTGIYEHYDLVPFEEYSLGNAYIQHLIVKFYKSEAEALTAYSEGSIEALGGVAPDEANKLKSNQYNLQSTPLPRVFALFFNQSSAPVLVNREVRDALNVSVNRLSLIDTILQGWGAVSKGAIPRGLSQNTEISGTASSTLDDEYIEAGKKILLAKGWKLNSSGIFEKQTKTAKSNETQTLRFSISTSNVPELKRSAEILKETWTKLGADVKVEIFEPSDLTQKVIRPRKYDSLLFGNVVGRDLDLYPFWHSSQRNDPGLNIALYTNIKADKVLETIRTTSDETKRLEAYRVFENEIQNDIPAIFLYSPDYIYATSKDIHNLEISNITTPSERFMNVHKWYLETEKVWKIFAK
ncbi:MAG: peptide ABC transporter substrate-binding protein [Candidatus Pacebacteria bacterium]|nr:peptide ABC transporter substrate-binding protein [Candidatus Paceibacterota bacterium]MBP9818529.1 peptide ABC transporter substrate-binding protein [Candidatus Paceibacterota bacterium]